MSYIRQLICSNLSIPNRKSGSKPYRLSQFADTEKWLTARIKTSEASTYLKSREGSMNSPNVALDLTIPKNYNHQREFLVGAVSDFLADKIECNEIIERISQKWNVLTDKVGRNSQKFSDSKSLGLNY